MITRLVVDHLGMEHVQSIQLILASVSSPKKSIYFLFLGGAALPDPPFKLAWRPPRLKEHIPSDTTKIVYE